VGIELKVHKHNQGISPT